jgi:hypothetical protein
MCEARLGPPWRRWRAENVPCAGMMRDGSDGLEPATSGVTVRSWRFRAERESAGIPGNSGILDLAVAGIGGSRRELPGASCGISAG